MRAKVESGEIEEYVPDADYEDAELPTDFDSATNWPHCAKIIGDIRDQSNCGCCWAFGARPVRRARDPAASPRLPRGTWTAEVAPISNSTCIRGLTGQSVSYSS